MNCDGGETVEKELGLGGGACGDAAVAGGVHNCIENGDFACLGLNRLEESFSADTKQGGRDRGWLTSLL